jgi:malonate transporter and related proteins
LNAVFHQLWQTLALPASLFQLMRGMPGLPPVDARLLLAFFGSCFIVFVVGRVVAWKCFGLDGVSQSVFALGGVFSNNVLLGTPLARATLGDAAMPAAALVVVFNALILWSLLTVSIEWARHGSLSFKGFGKTAWSVLTNPVIVGILLGVTVGYTGLDLPAVIEWPLATLARLGMPLALVALGMGLAEYGLGAHWPLSLSMTAIKLVLQPLCVFALARLIGLPLLETQVVVLLASIGTGANVYIMSRQFNRLEGAVAHGLIVSTALSALSTPLALAAMSWLA